MNENETLGHPLKDPVDSNSAYGWRTHPQTGERSFHNGEDYAVESGTPIVAVAESRVVFVGEQTYRREDGSIGGAGKYFIAEILDDGRSTGLYYSGFHASRIDAEVEDTFEKGETIAYVGSTGGSTGPHLHFELFEGGDESVIREGGIGRSGARRFNPNDFIGETYLDRITLREGDRNGAVAELQRDLIERGHLPPGSDDGDFGGNTRRAVEAFQREMDLEDDGIVGPDTRRALGVGTPIIDPPTNPAPEPTPSPNPAALGGFNTDGPFATTAVGDVLGGDTPLGSLTAEQSYAFGRAVLGDSEGAAALEFLDREIGTGDGVLVQRMVALGLHEGQLHAGRTNPDPSSGYNNGTFQLGGKNTTPEVTAANQERLFESGVDFLSRQGFRVDRDAVTRMDRDVIVHVGYLAERTGNAFSTPLPEDQLIRDLGDASITGDALVQLVHNDIQGGIEAIGISVRDWTDPQTGLGVDLDVLDARAREPDEVRREPAMPLLDRRLHPDNYDTSRGPVTSPAVEQWQAVLQAEGFLDDEPDGVFGDRTIAATRAAQTAAGLRPDGVVGPDTWAAYSEVLGQVVEGSSRPEPPADTPTPPETRPPDPTEPLGDVAPEEYSVRQFDGVAAVGRWDPNGERVAPSDDPARWVADTETPGNAGVQVTFPGAIEDAALVARPGSRLESMLDAMAEAGEAAQIRTATQVLADGQTSTGTYVLIDEATILEHYDSVDAYDRDVRDNGALQTAVDTPVLSDPSSPSGDGWTTTPVTPSFDPSAPRPGSPTDTIREHLEISALMDQVEGITENLLDRYIDVPESALDAATDTAREALYDRARGSDKPLTADDVRDTLGAGSPAVMGLTDLEARTVAGHVNWGVNLEREYPELAEARQAVREVGEVVAPPSSDAPTRGEAPVQTGDGGWTNSIDSGDGARTSEPPSSGDGQSGREPSVDVVPMARGL